MADDLNFSKKVPSTQTPEPMPEPYQRGVSVQESNIPNYQESFQKFAADSNWMSAIGSAVASKASSALATDLGSKAGQNPHGDLGPAITDFDKVYQDSYRTQAHATLGIQANQLITDANLEMAKAPRLTPDMIAKTNQQVSIGLQNIFNNAPSEIRPQLEYQYQSQRISQNADLTERMLREQREDRKANTAHSSNVNAESAYDLSFKGNYKGALAAVDATSKANQSDVEAGVSTPQLAKTNIDTVRQSALSGKYAHDYEEARAQGKGEEFLRNLADKRPDDLSTEDYPIVASHLMKYITEQQTLRNQDQALTKAKFKVSLIQDPTGITGAQIADLKTKLTPVQFQDAMFDYFKTLASIQKKDAGKNQAIATYTDINKFPTQSADNKNAAWQDITKAIKEKPESAAVGMTDAEAKIQAAAIAPTAIPAYIEELNAKLSTADPVQLEEASQAVNYFSKNNLNQNLVGLNDNAYGMIEVYGQLKQTMSSVEAAQQAHEVVYNKSKEQKEANKEALVDYFKAKKKNNETPLGIIKNLIGTPNVLQRNLPGYNQKALGVFTNFFNITNGDDATATKMTKQYMESQYGLSSINGEQEYMFHPIEKIPGVPSDAVGAIQSDIVEQANTKFKESKQLFDNKKSDFWYEARLEVSPEEAKTSKRITDAIKDEYVKHPITGMVFDVNNKRQELNKHNRILDQFNGGQKIVVVKHNRSGKDELFEGAVQANPWGVTTGNPNQPVSGGWDFMIKTPTGMQNIALQNPINSNVTYNPRVDYIKNVYLSTKGLSLLERLNPETNDLVKQHFNVGMSKILEQ